MSCAAKRKEYIAGGGDIRELGLGAQELQNYHRLKMTIAYDGGEFAGFQFQPVKVRTVQGELEKAATRLFLGCSRMVGASRTDAGAHANGQVAHFDVHGQRDSLESDLMMFNGFLPPDVKVLDIRYAEPGFDSLNSSIGKTYSYRIITGVPHPMQSRYRWWLFDRYCTQSRGKPLTPQDLHLDVVAMREAAASLLGTHDFTALADTRRAAGLGNLKRKKPYLVAKGIRPKRNSEKNTRTLGELEVIEEQNPVSGGQEVTVTLTGEGFLYHMVRVIVGALVEVGHGRISPAKFAKAVAEANRDAFPEAAPAHGLYLERVWYSESREELLSRCSNMDVRQALVAALAAKEALRRGERGGSGVQALSDDDGDGPPIKGITPTATVEAPTTPQPAAATAPQSSASALQ